jgi:hypothetical protein
MGGLTRRRQYYPLSLFFLCFCSCFFFFAGEGWGVGLPGGVGRTRD